MQKDTFYTDFPTAEAVKSLFTLYDAQDEQARAASEKRMENYYNCLDDYSWGGICDRASDESRGQRNSARNILSEQLERGTGTIEIFEQAVLLTTGGQVASTQIVNGKFGECWLIKEGNNVSFVGVAKKQATYEKKGYRVGYRRIEVEYYYTTRSGKNGLITRGRVLSNELVNALPADQSTHLPSAAYFALVNDNA